MVFVGRGALLWRAVQFAVGSGLAVDFVFTDDALGPGRHRALGVPTKFIEDINLESELIDKHCKDRTVWSIDNSMIFRDPFFALKLRCYNIHNGLLPAYRGRAAVAVLFAILNCEKEYGATLHEVDRGIDTGAPLDVERYAIHEGDRFHDVMMRGVGACGRLFEKNVVRVSAGAARPMASAEPRACEGYYGLKQLRELRRFADHPNFARATDLGMFGHYFPEVVQAIAAAR